MTKVVMRRSGASLVPAEDEADGLLRDIPEDARVVVDVLQCRSVDQLRKWWQLMTILAKNMPDVVNDKRVVVDKNIVSDMVLVACHECDIRVDPRTGEVWPKARSIAFENMSEDAFNRLWRRAVFYVETNWVPIGTTKLQREVDRFFHRDGAAESLGEYVREAA